MMNSSPSADGMNRPSTLRRASTMSRDVPAHRALVAGQQVTLVAGHHALAPIGHLGAPHRTLLATFLATELGARQRLSPCPGLRRGHRRRCDRALASGVASRRGPSLGCGGLPGCGTEGSAASTGVCGIVPAFGDALVFLSTQQFHARQVTSRRMCRRKWPGRSTGLTVAQMTGSAHPYADLADAHRTGQLRRHPDRGRGGRRHRGGLEPGAPRRSPGRRPAVRRRPGIRRRAGRPGGGAAACCRSAAR